jgi:hypothetical protein
MPEPWANIVVGTAMGVLLGILTGVVFVLCLVRATEKSKTWLQRSKWLITKILALPTFWFGGPWLTGELLAQIDYAGVLPWYALSLAVVFAAVVIRPVVRFVIWAGNSLGV